jgi:membrane-associated protein
MSPRMASYAVGSLAGRRLPARLTDTSSWKQAADLFSRRGVWAVFFSRFLLTPIALPINLMAGSTGLGWRRFALPVVSGEVIWVAMFGGLGAAFAGSWEALSGLAGDVAGLLVGAVVAAFALWKLRAARRSGNGGP